MTKAWRATLGLMALLAVSSTAFGLSDWSSNGYKKVTGVSWDGEKKRTMFQLENGDYFEEGFKPNTATTNIPDDIIWCDDKGYFEVRSEDGAKEALALLTSAMLSGRTVQVMVRQDMCGAYKASLATLISVK